MTFKDRYNKISKHIFMLALLPQSPYLFKYTCILLSKGIMRASQEPVDTHLTEWPWFKAGIAILKQPLFDESDVSSPDELNVSDWAYRQILEGFGKFVKSLRWYIQRQEQYYFADWKDEDGPPPSIEMQSSSAYAILKDVLYPIDGGYLAGDPDEGGKIRARPMEDLLFYNNRGVGILEFRPWSLKHLYEDCDKKLDLGCVPWGALLDQRAMFRNWYDNYLEEQNADEEDLESYLTMLEQHLPDISEDRWFEGYERSTRKACPPPPSPPSPTVEVKQEKSGMRFEIIENTPEGCTTYHDLTFDASYVISNRTNAKKIIDSLMIADLKNGVKQWHDNWAGVKGAFVRDDGSRFKNDQIEHQSKPSFKGGKTEQYTGKWRIRTDEEMAEWAKTHGPSQKAKMTV